jgi:hypothetical protein
MLTKEEIFVAICRWNAELIDTRAAKKRERITEIIRALEGFALARN